ncbi:hypothetical protein Poli38472_013520 [Pythium oligandrum]|uniref:INTS8 TPR repeats domain-containing protein n=1 Tax=Pythium oligandrum TaxID=41045 RepID=A0A8K1C7X6_PYTOL|nr:hypothetical protein Poli38472_013520 [Pythium oligandrum]|eukprot:TMW58046.1 hypothetical protein Poli38472_013520 [Pythium oligandrum]
MVVMPGSPRPNAEDDGVYRSIFQQPQLEIPPRAPSYAWFEFLLHPDALQRHLTTLRQQQADGTHSATSAIELVREFLDQAQLVADEGNGRNNRYSALLRLAAQVALQMKIPLDAIEQELPLHFQRLLLDGIVDFAESEQAGGRSEFTQDVAAFTPRLAQLLHHRWTLRTLVKESQNGYLTATNKNDAEEQVSGFQVALHELVLNHLNVANSVQSVLMEDNLVDTLPLQMQFDAFYDLAIYFFSFAAYEKAYECFSRAFELVEDQAGADPSQFQVSAASKASLEGYLAACEAVLASSSTGANETNASSPSLSTQIDDALAAHDLAHVVELLETDVIADATTKCPPGYRQSVELQVLRMLRQTPSHQLRDSYKRVALSNALDSVYHSTTSAQHEPSSSVSASYELQTALCVVSRLLQEEAMVQARHPDEDAAALFMPLVLFTLRLTAHLEQNAPSAAVRDRLQSFVTGLVHYFPCIPRIDGASSLLQRIGIRPPETDANALDMMIANESTLRLGAKRQRSHYRAATDLNGLYVFSRGSGDKDALLQALQEEGERIVFPSSVPQARSLAAFLTLHSSWDVLEQWKSRLDASAPVAATVDLALASGALMQYVATSITVSESNDAHVKIEFVVTRCNHLLHEVLRCRRAEAETTGDEDEDGWLVMLPLWLLETLVSVSAGLLHRASTRNLSDHRVSFDLTPYGDVALLVAFAPETTGPSEDVSDEALATTQLIKSSLREIVALHAKGIASLVRRCPREPRWHSARADLALFPLTKAKQPSPSDPRAALCDYLAAASLATNYFSDSVSAIDIIDQNSLVRMSQCLVKVGAHVAAAVLYQCFGAEEFKYGLRILQLAPETHDAAFFQFFWELPFLELLVHLHASAKHHNPRHVTLLTHLIQSPELNAANPSKVQQEVQQRILRCYLRELCRQFVQ